MVVVVTPSVLRDSSRLISLVNTVEGLMDKYSLVLVAGPAYNVEEELWRFTISPHRYSWERIVKTVMSRYASMARGAVTSERELEILRGEYSRLSDDMARIAWTMAVAGESWEQAAALLLSYGSKLSAALTAAALRSRGIEAVWLSGREAGIIAVGKPLNADPDYAASSASVKAKISILLEHGVVPVVAGGVAGSSTGRIMMLGWAGEVLTGLVLGNLLGAREVRVLREPPGIYPVEPPQPGAEPLRAIGVGQAVLLARLGLLRLTPKAGRNMVMEVKLVYMGFTGQATHVTPVGGGGAVGIVPAIIGRPAPSGEEYCEIARVEVLGGKTVVVQELGSRPFCSSKTRVVEAARATLLLLAGVKASPEQLGLKATAALPASDDSYLVVVEEQNIEDIALGIHARLREGNTPLYTEPQPQAPARAWNT
ncbi:hypothetical protein [Hyperthermus butylicus]|uniref:amino acid kinase family protein n=1 Tax=Hyperthermus butylicus TaxID=54248 RepID=UPI00064EDF96|nr:hypothetical protein [Hyperthermus butylicus]